jgi:hypothetical protein
MCKLAAHALDRYQNPVFGSPGGTEQHLRAITYDPGIVVAALSDTGFDFASDLRHSEVHDPMDVPRSS